MQEVYLQKMKLSQLHQARQKRVIKMRKNSSKTQVVLVLSTTNSLASAEKISTLLVEEKLAACVNVIPKIKSIYSWKDKICADEEFLMLIKTREKLYSKLEKRILALHPYEVPEIVSIPFSGGNRAYLEWIRHETNKEQS